MSKDQDLETTEKTIAFNCSFGIDSEYDIEAMAYKMWAAFKIKDNYHVYGPKHYKPENFEDFKKIFVEAAIRHYMKLYNA